MKCPKCDQQPMSFVKFFLKVNPLRINCVSCGTKLRAGSLLYGLFTGGAIYGFILGLVVVYLTFVCGWELWQVVLLFILGAFAVGLPGEFIAWRYGHYKI